jgi:hypothetical protein
MHIQFVVNGSCEGVDVLQVGQSLMTLEMSLMESAECLGHQNHTLGEPCH